MHDRSWQNDRPSSSESDNPRNSSGWRPDLSEGKEEQSPPRDAWGDGAWDRGSSRGQERGGNRQGSLNNWDREGAQRWPSRDRSSASSQGSGRGGAQRWQRRDGPPANGQASGREGMQRWQSRDGPSANGLESSSGRALRDGLQGEAVYGVNPVLGALQAMRREVHVLYVQEGGPPESLRAQLLCLPWLVFLHLDLLLQEVCHILF